MASNLAYAHIITIHNKLHLCNVFATNSLPVLTVSCYYTKPLISVICTTVYGVRWCSVREILYATDGRCHTSGMYWRPGICLYNSNTTGTFTLIYLFNICCSFGRCLHKNEPMLTCECLTFFLLYITSCLQITVVNTR